MSGHPFANQNAFANDYYGFAGHDATGNGGLHPTMMDDDQAMAGAVAAAAAAAGDDQLTLRLTGPMPDQQPQQQMAQMPPQMSPMAQLAQMQQMQQMQQQMAQMQQQHLQQQQQQHQQHQQMQMQHMPMPGQGPLAQTTQPQDSDILAYLNNPSFFDSFCDISYSHDATATPAGGPTTLAATAPGSMFPPALPPSSFSTDPSDPGVSTTAVLGKSANTTVDNGPDKDMDMLDVGVGVGVGVGAGDASLNNHNHLGGPGGTTSSSEPGGGPLPVEELIQTTTAGASTTGAATTTGSGGNAATSSSSNNNNNSSHAGASSLTEFTRRKNWPAKLIEEMRDVLIIIDNNQRIKYASPSIATVLGYSPKKATGLVLDQLVHRDDQAVFLADLNASIASGTQLRLFLRIRKGNYKASGSRETGHGEGENDDSKATADDNADADADADADDDDDQTTNTNDDTATGPEAYRIVEVVGHAHVASSRCATNPTNLSPFCQAVFLVARPYPTKNASLLDSFLEHKMENERLQRRIDDLRREEKSEACDDESQSQSQSQSAYGHTWRRSMDAGSLSMPPPPPTAAAGLGMGAGGLTGPGGLPGGLPAGIAGMSSQDISHILAQNPALTRENLEGISGHKADSLLDKIMRYNGGKTDTIDHGAVVAGQNRAGSSATATATATGATTTAATGTGTTGGGPSVANTISLLTGLYYAEGERSRGLSTGNRSPRLIQGDAGIAILANRADRTGSVGGAGGAGGMGGSGAGSGDKKKKPRVADEYVCNDCGTLDSPEWRKGPGGPKTLCNACGLRWAKKEKKEKKAATLENMAGGRVPDAPPGAFAGATGMA